MEHVAQHHPTVQPDLSGIHLNRSDLHDADLSYANLRGADINNTNLRFADLSYAILHSASLSYTDLSYANLININLESADLEEANLKGTNLKEANLKGANLEGVYLNDADLEDADLSNAQMWGTSLGDRDLRLIKGLNTVRHGGPSPLSINTIFLSQGDIPEKFVRGTGAPDSFLEYMKALASKPIEYYTCFISYSHHDEAFARHLYADLQSQNVRCWFAPHDMRIGDEIRSRIDESIRVHDKLLLILSQHSIESAWVQKEVETAFEKEQQQGKLVLFPVKLDDTIMQTNEAWAADIRRMRHIGDFQHWKNHDDYMQAFERLLRDLKADDNIKP